jgi:hypothetical protein
MRTIQIGALVSVLLLTGCQSTRESTALQDNMGKAVAQMKRDQISNPATAIGPNDAPVEGMDPQSANNALEAMRKDQPERAVIRRDIQINVGSQQASGNQ